ncbi:MAG: glycosyltransferase family 2 protein [Faecousia sp.]
MERISVIVPAYNLASCLGGSLDSLLAQTYPDLEIVVVDDGSTDDTGRIIREYSGKFPNIKAIFKENGGVTSARLRGVAEATGDWIGFMDGDDYVEPQMYARLLENAHASGADISHCGHQICFSDGRVEYVHRSEKIRQQDHRTGLWELLDNREVSLSLCTKLYRRELFAGLADWMPTDIRYNEDLLMNYYLFDHAKSAVFEGVCPYHYLLRKDSASCRGISQAYIFDPIRVRRLLLERCAPEMREDVQQALLRNLLFNYAQLDVHPQRKQYGQYRQRVREMLRKEQDTFRLLSVRNKTLANMICYAPWSFHIAYGAYVALFQREEQH